ncbi:MAG: glycosyltransferase [Myxococcales bacterium]|nr:glycosyltransferase [Myxococcales bacterium]
MSAPLRGGRRQRPTRVLLLNTADRGGGAERISCDLLDGLSRRGLEARLVVGDKQGDDPRVLPVWEHPHVPLLNLWHRTPLHRVLDRAARGRDRRRGLEDFRFPHTRHLETILGSPPDVVLCRNLHGGWFDLRALARLSQRVPVILLLADCWPFTGHCVYPLGCERWEHGCPTCPHLDRPAAIEVDGAARNWKRKRDVYRKSRLHVASPSEWLLARARRSMLAPAIRSERVIPHGTDLSVFRPGDRARARRALGIADETFVMTFVANGGDANPFKDVATLRHALERLPEGPRPAELRIVGGGGPDERWGAVRVRRLPYRTDRAALAEDHRASDVLVHPVVEEAFGNVVVEALACGTPVVASAAGGVAEIVRHGEHGLLVPPGDAPALAAALAELRDRPLLARQLGKRGAQHAREHQDQERVIERYREWIERLARGEHG